MADDEPMLFSEEELEAMVRRGPDLEDDEPDWDELPLQVASTFTPNYPVNERDLFAGRSKQISRLVGVVNQLGQHAILYGERGVGKTSLANVLQQFLSTHATVISPRVNADSGDSFDRVWRKAFEQIDMKHRRDNVMGFTARASYEDGSPIDLIDGKITPDAVRRILVTMTADTVPILIFDEFDRLPPKARASFADLIKTLSDQAVEATILLVGVAETIEELIDSHESVSRALVQIQLQRMAASEIEQIVNKGLDRLGMDIELSAKRQIVLLSQGLPYYTHLICQHASLDAIEARTLLISEKHVRSAVTTAIEDAQGTIRKKYHTATTSSRKGSLFADVLLACALAQRDDLGFFAAQSVVQPLCEITKRDYGIPTFSQHLDDFSSDTRGNVLTKEGSPRRFRFRFTDPLMQPYVLMQGLAKERITQALLSRVGV